VTLFLDSSAIAKLYVQETGTQTVQDAVDKHHGMESVVPELKPTPLANSRLKIIEHPLLRTKIIKLENSIEML
jgi:hypothetical protein